ncbi:hypothetical protein [Candidatus Hodarchaeum mangrovi]
MSIEIDYEVLANIPSSLFQRLIEQWQNNIVNLEPSNIFSSANEGTTKSILATLPQAKLRNLLKLGRILEIKDIWWESYLVPKIKSFSNFEGRIKTFEVDKYIDTSGSKAKAFLNVIELSRNALLVLIEFSSRSPSLRRIYRYIFFPAVKIILLEPQEYAVELFQDQVLPFISNESQITLKPVRAKLIKQFTKISDNKEASIILTHLKIRISLETSGIEGLSQIIIEGKDVIRGAETLEQRHEISLKFMQSGPWVGAGTDDFIIEVGKGIQIIQIEEQSLKNIATVLSWL